MLCLHQSSKQLGRMVRSPSRTNSSCATSLAAPYCSPIWICTIRHGKQKMFSIQRRKRGVENNCQEAEKGNWAAWSQIRRGMSVCCFVNWIIFGNSIFIRASFLSYLYLYNATSLYALQSRGTIPTTLSVFFVAFCVLVLHSCGDCIPQECPTSFLLLFLIWKENKRQGEKFFKSLDRIRIRGKGRYITRNNVVSRRRKPPQSTAEESPVYKWNVLEMGRRTKARTRKMKM